MSDNETFWNKFIKSKNLNIMISQNIIGSFYCGIMFTAGVITALRLSRFKLEEIK